MSPSHPAADQLYGDQSMHQLVRRLCLDYMAVNEDHYSQYVTEDFRRVRLPLSCLTL